MSQNTTAQTPKACVGVHVSVGRTVMRLDVGICEIQPQKEGLLPEMQSACQNIMSSGQSNITPDTSLSTS